LRAPYRMGGGKRARGKGLQLREAQITATRDLDKSPAHSPLQLTACKSEITDFFSSSHLSGKIWGYCTSSKRWPRPQRRCWRFTIVQTIAPLRSKPLLCIFTSFLVQALLGNRGI